MESRFAQFTMLSDQALYDKNFNPNTIEDDLMKLFEVEAYKAWASMELDQENQVKEAENYITTTIQEETEEHVDSAMDNAMEEYRRFEEEMNQMMKDEYDSLVSVAEKARKMGKDMEKMATFAAKKYIEAAVSSAGASMKSAVKAVSFNSNKIHPS